MRVVPMFSWLAASAALIFIALSAQPASASDYLAGTLHWEAVDFGLPGEVSQMARQALPPDVAEDLPLTVAVHMETWWKAWGANIQPGTRLAQVPFGTINMGDGSTLEHDFLVTARHGDFYGGIIVAEGGENPPIYAYSKSRNNGEPWEIHFTTVSRNPHGHVNNPNMAEALRIRVDGLVGDPPGATRWLPRQPCQVESICQFQVEATSPSGQDLYYEFQDSARAVTAGSFIQPGPPWGKSIQLNEETGELTWDTRGLQQATPLTRYSIEVVAGDGETETPIDFVIELMPPDICPIGTPSFDDHTYTYYCPCPVQPGGPPESPVEAPAYVAESYHDRRIVFEDCDPCIVDPDSCDPCIVDPDSCDPCIIDPDSCELPCDWCGNEDPRLRPPWYAPPPTPTYDMDPAYSGGDRAARTPQDRIDEAVAALDTDADGIEDRRDSCPNAPDDGRDQDGDGLGDACDADRDGDGRLNLADLCPDDPLDACVASEQPQSAQLARASAGDRDAAPPETVSPGPVPVHGAAPESRALPATLLVVALGFLVVVFVAARR